MNKFIKISCAALSILSIGGKTVNALSFYPKEKENNSHQFYDWIDAEFYSQGGTTISENGTVFIQSPLSFSYDENYYELEEYLPVIEPHSQFHSTSYIYEYYVFSEKNIVDNLVHIVPKIEARTIWKNNEDIEYSLKKELNDAPNYIYRAVLTPKEERKGESNITVNDELIEIPFKKIESPFDVNKDGTVNIFDLISLKKYLLNS